MRKNVVGSNPFVTYGSIPRDCFCDREKESECLVRLLADGGNALLLSERGIGKTSLIDYCFSDPRIRDNYLTVTVNLLLAKSLEEMTTLLANGVIRAVAPLGKSAVKAFLRVVEPRAGVPGLDPNTGLPIFRLCFSRWKNPEAALAEIFEFLGSRPKPCLIALDEFQQVANFEEQNAEAALRSLIQGASGCNFVFAGRRQRMMREAFLSCWQSCRPSTSLLELQPIPVPAYAAFAARMFEEAGKSLETGAAEWLHEELCGNTYCLQSTMNAAFALTRRRSVCDRPTLEMALRSRVLEKLPDYKQILSWLSCRQQTLLLAIANEGMAEHLTSAAFVEKYRLGSPSIVQAARKKLLQWDLITESEGCCRVTDPFFEYAERHWFFDVRVR